MEDLVSLTELFLTSLTPTVFCEGRCVCPHYLPFGVMLTTFLRSLVPAKIIENWLVMWERILDAIVMKQNLEQKEMTNRTIGVLKSNYYL